RRSNTSCWRDVRQHLQIRDSSGALQPMTANRKITADLDVLVVGGGIAGLWLLNRLVAAGYSAALIEKGDLGGGQTVHAQGIIHGGTKYNLRGRGSDSANALAAMPATWR